MTSLYIIILCFIFLIKHNAATTSIDDSKTEVTTDFRLWKGVNSGMHHRHHLKSAHGILNMIGWGILLPIGMIISRYFRKYPIKCDDEWYTLHILCQSSGYILGTIGWSIGLWLGNTSKHYSLKTHRALGILVFTFATIQMLATFLQPRRGDECRKCWEVCHQVMGYAVIGLSIANIFEGIIHQSHAEKWKWVYVGILGVLGLLTVVLEVFRWIVKCRNIQQQMALDTISPEFGFTLSQY